MHENKQQKSIISEPKREDYKDDIDFELARIDYWYSTKTPDYRIQNIVEMMETHLLCKLGHT